jgi:hypothetical protein
MLNNLEDMSTIAIDIFHTSFFTPVDQNQSLTASANDNNRLEFSTIQNLQTKLLGKLGDWFSFIETKSQGNITISLFVLNYFLLVVFHLIAFYLVVNIIFQVLFILHLLIDHVVEYVHQHYLLRIIKTI